MTLRVEEIYERYIKPLPTAAKLSLMALMAQELAEVVSEGTLPQRSLLELEGLGAEIWQGIDAQEYVNELRKELDTQR
jgi:hypothetical protein